MCKDAAAAATSKRRAAHPCDARGTNPACHELDAVVSELSLTAERLRTFASIVLCEAETVDGQDGAMLSTAAWGVEVLSQKIAALSETLHAIALNKPRPAVTR